MSPIVDFQANLANDRAHQLNHQIDKMSMKRLPCGKIRISNHTGDVSSPFFGEIISSQC